MAAPADWCAERGTLGSKWQQTVHAVRAKLEELLNDLPDEPEVQEYVRDPAEMSYFDCKRTFDALLKRATANGDAGKTLLGSWSNTQLRAWDSLLSEFRSRNAFLGDAGRLMSQRTDHEIPAIKGRTREQSDQLQDIARKVTDTTRNAAQAEQQLGASCTSVGIPGVNYRSELKALAKELPKLLGTGDAAIRVEDVERAASLYRDFSAFSLAAAAPASRSGTGGSKGRGRGKKGRKAAAKEAAEPETSGADAAAALLPTLQSYLALAPVEVDDIAAADGAAEAAGGGKDGSSGEEIDWGAMLSVDGGGGGDEAPAAPECVDIDWGAMLSVEGGGGGDEGEAPAPAAAGGDNVVDIDWGLALGASADGGATEQAAEINWDGDAAPAAAAAGGAGGDGDAATTEINDAATFLQDSSKRAALLDDLLELRAFLRQRAKDMADAANLVFHDQWADAPRECARRRDTLIEKYSADAVAMFRCLPVSIGAALHAGGRCYAYHRCVGCRRRGQLAAPVPAGANQRRGEVPGPVGEQVHHRKGSSGQAAGAGHCPGAASEGDARGNGEVIGTAARPDRHHDAAKGGRRKGTWSPVRVKERAARHCWQH